MLSVEYQGAKRWHLPLTSNFCYKCNTPQ